MKGLKARNIAFLPPPWFRRGHTNPDHGELWPAGTDEHLLSLKTGMRGADRFLRYTFDMEAVRYRFANVAGSRSTHNVMHDFIHKLEKDCSRPEILASKHAGSS
jgi:hypothetical protein